MSGHNKWSKIKHKKEASDARKSKEFSKIAKLLAVESKKTSGDRNAPSLKAAVERARAVNMPSDNIDRAIKKGEESSASLLTPITYEAYGPGGAAMIIEVLTDNRNKAAAEIKHILAMRNFSFAGIGSVTWAFEKRSMDWIPQTTTPLSKPDHSLLTDLVNKLEENDEVQKVYTNAEQQT